MLLTRIIRYRSPYKYDSKRIEKLKNQGRACDPQVMKSRARAAHLVTDTFDDFIFKKARVDVRLNPFEAQGKASRSFDIQRAQRSFDVSKAYQLKLSGREPQEVKTGGTRRRAEEIQLKSLDARNYTIMNIEPIRKKR